MSHQWLYLQNNIIIMWILYALMAAFFAALTAIFAKMGVRNVNSDLATAIRSVVILVLTWGIVLIGGQIRGLRNIAGSTWIFLLLSGVATGLSWLFYFKALQEGDVSKVAPLDKLSVVFTLILAVVFLKEPVSPRVMMGTCLIVAGGVLMVTK